MNHTHNQPTTAGVDTPARVLRDAALYLERHGWIQGRYYTASSTTEHPPSTPTPPACALGAIGMAAYGHALSSSPTEADRDAWPVFNLAEQILQDHLSLTWITGRVDEYDSVPDWNDESGRTAEQVIATLRAAADEWDRIHGGAR